MAGISSLIHSKIINGFVFEFADQLGIHERMDRGVTCPDLQHALVLFKERRVRISLLKMRDSWQGVV